MIAAPGTISLLIAYNQEFQKLNEVLIILGAIVMATTCIYLVLKSSFLISKVFGAWGINAISRIIGFIVIVIGIELIISSVGNVFFTV